MFEKASLENRPDGHKLFLLIGLFFIGLALPGFIFALILLPFYGKQVFVDLNSIANVHSAEGLLFLKLLQGLSAIGAFIAPPFVLAYLCSKNPIEYLSLKKPYKAFFFLFSAFVLIISSQPLINFLVEINSQLNLPVWMKEMEEAAEQLTKSFLKMDQATDILLNIFVVAVLPAFGEELLFRGAFQKLFTKLSGNIHAGIWIAAALFSAIHFQFMGFIPRMAIGALLGYLFYWSGSIWIAVFGHFVNNAMGVLLSFFIQRGAIEEDVENIGRSENGYIYIAASLIIVSLFLFRAYKNRIISRKGAELQSENLI
jgi:membrane protease YdiL (CAAX protease family)